MIVWYRLNFNKLVDDAFAKLTVLSEMVSLIKCVFVAFEKVQETALYRMQHNGETVYLEKVLNDYYNIPGYDPVQHDLTKQIYIEDEEQSNKLYIFQDAETEVSFIEDDGDDSEDDLFIDNDEEGNNFFGFIIFIPDTVPFTEAVLRSVVNSYRYSGTFYTIQTYTL